jgi:hypothetical protein
MTRRSKAALVGAASPNCIMSFADQAAGTPPTTPLAGNEETSL